MKERALQRMNFLKQGKHGFTYRGMICGLVGWCVFLALAFAAQAARNHTLKCKIEMTEQRIVALGEEKERQIDLIKLASRKRAGISSRHDLASILASRPRWGNMLRALTRSLPSDVWLDFLDVRQDRDWYRIDIKGKARSQRTLTEFILQLEETGFFKKTALDSTQLSDAQSGTFEFELSTEPVAQKLLRDA